MMPKYSFLEQLDNEYQRGNSDVLLETDPAPNKQQYFTRFGVIRVLIETLLVIAVLFLSIKLFSRRQVLTNCAISYNNSSLIPYFPEKSVVFLPDKRYSNAESFTNKSQLNETLKFWKTMSTRTRGAIYLEPSERAGLPPPKHTKLLPTDKTPEWYMISVFHQLHCLSLIMTSYGLLAIEGKKANPEHLSHCFDELRQAILCAGDTTIEGETYESDGWGATHQCKDIDAVIKWADARPGLPVDGFGESGIL